MKQLSVREKQEHPRSELLVRRIDDLDQFKRIEFEWQELVAASQVDRVFMSHVWLTTWWESFGAEKRLHIITIYSGDKLIGAAPMMITNTRMFGIPVRRLESLYNCHTPRFDFPVSERHGEVYRAIWDVISAPGQSWDVVMLSQVPSESLTLLEMKRLAMDAGWFVGDWNPRPSLFIELGCDFDTLMSRMKSKARYNLRKRHSRLAELGKVDLEVIREPHLVRAAMIEGLRIEAAAWKGQNGTAINSEANVEEFYVRFAERAAELGWLRLCFLRLDDKRIAFDYVIEKDGILYGVKIGYDPKYHSNSPGHLLLVAILQQSSQRCLKYDFLGSDDEWKYMWTKEASSHQWLFLFRNTFRSRLLHAAKFRLGPWLKSATSRVRTEDRLE